MDKDLIVPAPNRVSPDPPDSAKSASERSSSESPSSNQRSPSQPAAERLTLGSIVKSTKQEPESGGESEETPLTNDKRPSRSVGEENRRQQVTFYESDDSVEQAPTDKLADLSGFTRALQFGKHRHPESTRVSAIGQKRPRGDKCNMCAEIKPPTISWEDHNVVTAHVQALVNTRGYDTAVQLLESNCRRFVDIRCDLCDTWFNTKVLFNAHKEIGTHEQRFQLFQSLLNTAVSTCPDIKRWQRVRCNKIVPSIISKSLKYQRSRKK